MFNSICPSRRFLVAEDLDAEFKKVFRRDMTPDERKFLHLAELLLREMENVSWPGEDDTVFEAPPPIIAS